MARVNGDGLRGRVPIIVNFCVHDVPCAAIIATNESGAHPKVFLASDINFRKIVGDFEGDVSGAGEIIGRVAK